MNLDGMQIYEVVVYKRARRTVIRVPDEASFGDFRGVRMTVGRHETKAH